MEDVVASLGRAAGELDVRQIALQELDVRNVIEIALLAGDERIGDPNPVPTAHQFRGQVGTDETGAAGDQILSHAVWTLAINVHSRAAGCHWCCRSCR